MVKITRQIAYIGYILVGLFFNGLLGIYWSNKETSSPLWIWILLGALGFGILILKYFHFKNLIRLTVLLYDVLFVMIFLVSGLASIPYGLNFIAGSIIGVLYLVLIIDRKYLVLL